MVQIRIIQYGIAEQHKLTVGEKPCGLTGQIVYFIIIVIIVEGRETAPIQIAVGVDKPGKLKSIFRRYFSIR